MEQQIHEQTTGMNVHKDVEPIEINGKKYKLRRLGILDVFAFMEIIQKVMAKGNKELVGRIKGAMAEQSEELVSAIIFHGFPACKEPILEWISDLIDVPKDDYINPEIFPIQSHLDILESIITHPDIEVFFMKLKEMAKEKGAFSKIKEQFGKSS